MLDATSAFACICDSVSLMSALVGSNWSGSSTDCVGSALLPAAPLPLSAASSGRESLVIPCTRRNLDARVNIPMRVPGEMVLR